MMILETLIMLSVRFILFDVTYLRCLSALMRIFLYILRISTFLSALDISDGDAIIYRMPGRSILAVGRRGR